MFTKLEAQVLLDGLDISSYIIELKRNHVLCNILQTFSITLDKTLLDYLDANLIKLKPSNTIVIYEFGVKVLTGHVRSVKRSRTPDYVLQIEGTDTYKYAKDYFIDSSIGTSKGESVLYWTQALLNLAGLNLVIDTSIPGNVGPEIEFNLRTVDDALTEVVSYASAYLYTDPDGNVHIQKGALSSNITFTGGTPDNVDIIHPTSISGFNVTKATHKYSDENTRNIAKVWGFKGNIILRSGESPYIISEQSVDLGLPVPKTTVYASNYVQTQQEADRLSNEIISALGRFDSIKIFDTVGNPNVRLGRTAGIDVNMETSHIIETSIITGVASDISKDGYTMQVTLDEFCPKFAGWELANPSINVYAGTTRNGIYKSFDKGNTWASYNDGIFVNTKNVKKIAADQLDQTMAIINGGLYKRTPTTNWSLVSLPAPVNTAGDSPAHTFNAYTGLDNTVATTGAFSVLTSYADHRTMTSGVLSSGPINRSWVYDTKDFGVTWTSTQVQNETDFGYYGIDLSSKYGIPYVITSSQVEEWSNTYGKVRLIKSKPFKRASHNVGGNWFEHGVDNHCVNDLILFNPVTNVYGPSITPTGIEIPIYGVSPLPSHGEVLTSISSNCYYAMCSNEFDKPEPVYQLIADLVIADNPLGMLRKMRSVGGHNTINGHFWYGTLKISRSTEYPSGYGLIGFSFVNMGIFLSPVFINGFTGCTKEVETPYNVPKMTFDAWYMEWETN